MTMKIKKVIAGVFAVMLIASVALFATACGGSGGGIYTPGEYTGEGTSMGGTIEVTITVDENNITDVAITDPGETEGMGGKEAIADGTYKNQIIDAQSAEIDGVSGATITSDGVKTATEDAIAKAKGE